MNNGCKHPKPCLAGLDDEHDKFRGNKDEHGKPKSFDPGIAVKKPFPNVLRKQKDDGIGDGHCV